MMTGMSRPPADRPGPPDSRRPRDDATGTPSKPSAAGAERRRRTALFSLVAALLVGALGVAWFQRSGPDDPPDLEVLGWLPYWVAEDGLASLERAGGELSVVSPFWFVARGPTTILADDHADPAATEAAMAAARASGAAVVPSVLDGMDAGGMAAVLGDPASRAVHVDAVIGFVVDNGFDGVDLDYEQFAFADDRSTWEATRPAWVAFVEELSGELHRRGKVLHVSVPPVYDSGRSVTSGYWVYDHGAIIDFVDRLRIMTYDYSPGEPGPIAPIDWVVSSLDGTIEATGSPDRLALGIPFYGYNWFVGTTGSCSEPGDTGRTTVTQRSLADLIARRGATPAADTVNAEITFEYRIPSENGDPACDQRREVHLVDVNGALQRIELARDRGLSAVSLWAIGYESEDFWVRWSTATPATGPGSTG